MSTHERLIGAGLTLLAATFAPTNAFATGWVVTGNNVKAFAYPYCLAGAPSPQGDYAMLHENCTGCGWAYTGINATALTTENGLYWVTSSSDVGYYNTSTFPATTTVFGKKVCGSGIPLSVRQNPGDNTIATINHVPYVLDTNGTVRPWDQSQNCWAPTSMRSLPIGEGIPTSISAFDSHGNGVNDQIWLATANKHLFRWNPTHTGGAQWDPAGDSSGRGVSVGAFNWFIGLDGTSRWHYTCCGQAVTKDTTWNGGALRTLGQGPGRSVIGTDGRLWEWLVF